MAQIVNDENFEAEVLKSDIPVLVDFWAEWCGPCKMLSPTIEELAKDLQGKVKVVKLNVDNSQITAAKYGITSIPTIIIFENGQEKASKSGLLPKAEYLKMLGL